MYIHSRVCAILIAALCVFNCCLCLDTSCDLERIRVPGNIVISAIVGLREPINKECGKYGASEIMVASAMVWAVTKLNGSPGHPSFIPNKTIGIEMSDDCFLERKAVQIGLDMLRAVKSPDVATCAKSACHNETSQFVGLIDTSTSQTTGRVAELFRGTNMPVIATAATAADLGNRTRYPTFFRLVPSDVKQMKVLLETLKALSWTYVAVVYTTDAYGIEGLEMLRKFASTDEKVCIMAELAISPQETRTAVARDILGLLATRLARTRHDRLGVIYIGQLSQAELLIRIQHLGASASLSFRDFQQIYWVMSEAVGTNNGLIQPSQVGGLLTVALSSPELSEFKTYFIDEVLKSVTSPTTTLAKLYTKYVESFFECEMGARGEKQCPILTRELLESRYKQADYVASAVDAVYVLASAVKQEYCIDGLQCSETSTKPPYTWPLQQRIQDSILDYTQFEAHLVPQEFQIPQRIIRFDNSGEIISVSSTPSYDIYNVWDKVHTKVGYYQDDKLTIHTDSINMKHPSGIKVSGSSLPKSSCRGGCSECVSVEGIPFHYIPGERIIVGLFSLSSKVNEDFKCGPFRSHTVSYLTFEAFNYAISAVREQHPHLNFGGLAFDDCYSPLRAEYILSSFLSGNYKLVDSNTNTPIDPSKVVLVVGPLSSDVSLEVADMLTRLKIPQISYGATSTDLNDRQKYPYFLRTVPSDESQAKVIVSILEEMNWKYVAAIHIDNNYGVRGMEIFKEMANKKGICVTGSIPLKDTVVLEDFEGVVSKLRKTYTTVVIFFGIDTLAEKVLDGLYQYANDEEFVFVATEAWGRNEKLLGDGRERVAKGSIILHSDTAAPALYKRFSDYMRTKNPFTCTKCRWLKKFWQDHFQCDLEDGYMGIGREMTLCNQNEHGVYVTKQDEQRVIHTIYAVQAAAKGIEAVVQSLCQRKVCTSSLRQMPRGAENLVRRISEVSLSPSPNSGSLFDKNGNGNVGFEILNIQYIPSLRKYEYKSVGHYSRSTLVLEKQKVVFYDQYKQPRPFDYVKTKCEKGLGQCDECEQQTSTPAPSNTTTAASTPRQSTGQSYKNQFIAMTILSVLAIVVIAVVFCCYCFRRKSTKSTKRDPQQEEGSTNPSFQNTSTSDITLGQISASIHDDPLYCEVNSINSSRAIMPGSCSGSRQASVGVCSAGGSGTGSSGSSGLTQLKLLKQKCLCPAPQMFGYVDTASGRLVICGHCQGVVNSTVVLPVDMSNV